MDNRPIGIFDSGMGGLTVWKELYSSLPHESLLYYADGINCPYGGRSDEEITSFTDDAVSRMLEEGIKLLVVACNTATAAAIKFLRNKYTYLPIVGMEPAVKPAALSTESGTVAILATEASLRGELFNKTSALYGKGVRIIPAVGEGFVELVEKGLENSPQAVEAVGKVVEPLIAAGADRIVLGCTHYNFLLNAIRQFTDGRGVEIVDAAPAVERRVEYLLDECGLRAAKGNVPLYDFFSPAGEDYVKMLKSRSERLKSLF